MPQENIDLLRKIDKQSGRIRSLEGMLSTARRKRDDASLKYDISLRHISRLSRDNRQLKREIGWLIKLIKYANMDFVIRESKVRGWQTFKEKYGG